MIYLPMMLVMRLVGTPNAYASAFADIPKSSSSSFRISPGWIGFILVVIIISPASFKAVAGQPA